MSATRAGQRAARFASFINWNAPLGASRCSSPLCLRPLVCLLASFSFSPAPAPLLLCRIQRAPLPTGFLLASRAASLLRRHRSITHPSSTPAPLQLHPRSSRPPIPFHHCQRATTISPESRAPSSYVGQRPAHSGSWSTICLLDQRIGVRAIRAFGRVFLAHLLRRQLSLDKAKTPNDQNKRLAASSFGAASNGIQFAPPSQHTSAIARLWPLI